jgi:hypothetical protein
MESGVVGSQAPPYSAYAADGATPSERGSGWVTFAGVMILVLGVVNVIYGIAAISNSTFYVADAKYIVSDLNTYGWVTVCIGAIQLLVGIGVFARVQIARWIGVLIAAVNLIAQLMWISAYPLAGLAFIAVDILVIYGLVAHGRKVPAY